MSTKAREAVRLKMVGILDQIGQGPLNSLERVELLGLLRMAGHRSDSLWADAIRLHFIKPPAQRNDSQLIEALASQCLDDLFTMVCIVGQKAAIYLLRTVKD